MKLTKSEKEDIGAKIENEGFDYYFNDYGPDEKLVSVIGPEIEVYTKARKNLLNALANLGIETEE